MNDYIGCVYFADKSIGVHVKVCNPSNIRHIRIIEYRKVLVQQVYLTNTSTLVISRTIIAAMSLTMTVTDL